MPSNTAVITALVALVIAFLGLYAVLGSAGGAALVAVGVAVLAGVAGQSFSKASGRRQLTRSVQDRNQRVAQLAARVGDGETRASLLRACERIPVLLERTEKHDPASLSMTSGKLLDYLASVESVLDRYLEIQAHPAAFHNADALLTHSARVLAVFETFAVHSADQVGQQDMERFFTALAHLELLNPPGLPRSEDR
ncbi:hypothetical protein JK358_33570 [Nocardia sp. 2]|uniref:5-bromo-4-chloroindolyl phosphate hydrolysis protein n=1 Tax=Nocardia acididurans TaxID=2802282 RepID=A0ABS1MFL8_9NOCA|nr:hypothetical protein [Nocardia acididurans]MBL1079346.1 hypothetical protein [Nocardia acididurans]